MRIDRIALRGIIWISIAGRKLRAVLDNLVIDHGRRRGFGTAFARRRPSLCSGRGLRSVHGDPDRPVSSVAVRLFNPASSNGHRNARLRPGTAER